MGYNVVDLIDKAIDIAIRRKNILEDIGHEKLDIQAIQIMSKVLSKEICKTIEYYETLKKELNNADIEEIDFVIYDKISFLINEFNKRIYASEINNVREYLKFSIDLLRDTNSLLVDIQGRLIKNIWDINTKTYKILSDLIRNIEGHIDTLEKNLR
jgi:hypothetical protein